MLGLIILFLNIFTFIESSKIIFPINKRMIDELKNHHDITPLYGNTSDYAYYYVDIFVGTPKSKETLIIDTGSSVMGWICECTENGCGHDHIDKDFKKSNSNTSRIPGCAELKIKKNINCDKCESDKCLLTSSYGEASSYSGYYLEDIVYMGDSFHEYDGISIPFGCFYKETNYFYTQKADGIIGLIQQEGKINIIKMLYDSRQIGKNLFSLCLGINGGYFSVGGINTDYHVKDSKIQYFKMKNSYYYSLDLKQIIIEGDMIDVGQMTDTILDSGTTVSLFPRTVYQRIISNIEKLCSDKKCGTINRHLNSICYILDKDINEDEYFSIFPKVDFLIEDSLITIFPKNYLYFIERKNKYCIGLQTWSRNQITLGTTWFHNKDIIFNIEEKQIGIVDSNCELYQTNKNKERNSDRTEFNSTSMSEIHKSGKNIDVTHSTTIGTDLDPQNQAKINSLKANIDSQDLKDNIDNNVQKLKTNNTNNAPIIKNESVVSDNKSISNLTIDNEKSKDINEEQAINKTIHINGSSNSEKFDEEIKELEKNKSEKIQNNNKKPKIDKNKIAVSDHEKLEESDALSKNESKIPYYIFVLIGFLLVIIIILLLIILRLKRKEYKFMKINNSEIEI